MSVKIRASRREYLEVDIEVRDIHATSVSLMKRKVIPPALPEEAYVNDEGKWESWQDTGHGSGFTTRYFAASEAEKAAFQIILEFERLTRRL